MLFKLCVANYFCVCAFCKINIVVDLSAVLNIAKAIFKLDRRIQNAYAGAKKIVRAKDFAFTSLCTNDCLMCKLTSKIYSEKLNYTFK